jgi:hypothetical protein
VGWDKWKHCDIPHGDMEWSGVVWGKWNSALQLPQTLHLTKNILVPGENFFSIFQGFNKKLPRSAQGDHILPVDVVSV